MDNTSILLIKSNDITNTRIGTGFVIYQDEFGSYVLTCQHVVEQVETPFIKHKEAEIISFSKELDLALLYVQGLSNAPFKLQQKKCLNRQVELVGFSGFSKEKYQKKSRKATLLDNDIEYQDIQSGKDIKGWEVVAKNSHEIEAGNSGGPLICDETGNVIAIMTNRKGNNRGYAVSIEHLHDIWDVPAFLFESDSETASPFVGLSAFSIEQAHLFFGRDSEVQDVLEKIYANSIVAVVGDSGSGKSSLVKAGVIPKYRNQEYEYEDEENFYAIDIRPAESPFDELALTLARVASKLDVKSEKISHLKQQVRDKVKGSILDAIEQIYQNENSNLLIYIDQFEELFTLCSSELQKEFITELLYLLEHQSNQLKIKIVLTIRKDYYNLISEYESLFNLTQNGKYILRRMINDQILQCIQEPLKLTTIDPKQISPFSKAILADMGDESGELTLLQIALTQTWRQRKMYDNNLLRTYHEIGEVSGSLAKLADDTWHILSSAEKKILEYIMIRIVKPSDTGGITRRLANRDEFSKEAWKLAQRLASVMSDDNTIVTYKHSELGRLLKIKGEEGTAVELSHEALVRQWPQYQKWLRMISKDDMKRTHDYLIEQNRIYHENGKKKKFLLKGYELERSKKLLDTKYRKYLSTEEIGFIKRSKWFRQFGYALGALAIGLIVVLALVSFFSKKALIDKNIELNQSSEIIKKKSNELVNTLNEVIDLPIGYMITNSKTSLGIKKEVNPHDVVDIFDYIVRDFKDYNDSKITKVVVKAWYGKALALNSLYQEKKVYRTYKRLISNYKDNNDSQVINYVIRAWLNKSSMERSLSVSLKSYAELIKYIDRLKSNNVFPDELKEYETTAKIESAYLLVQVDKIEDAYHALKSYQSRLTSDSESIKTFLAIYRIQILEGKYDLAEESIEKLLKLEKENLSAKLLLGHIYLLKNRKEEAYAIYKKAYQNPRNRMLKKIERDFKIINFRNSNRLDYNQVLQFIEEGEV